MKPRPTTSSSFTAFGRTLSDVSFWLLRQCCKTRRPRKQNLVWVMVIGLVFYFLLLFSSRDGGGGGGGTPPNTKLSTSTTPTTTRMVHHPNYNQNINNNNNNNNNGQILNEFATVDGVVFRPGSHYHCRKRSGQVITLPRLPSFVIVGAQKGGTSALNALLSHHRRIIRSNFFEPHFFDQHPAIANPKIRHALQQVMGVEQMTPVVTAATVVHKNATTTTSSSTRLPPPPPSMTMPYYNTPPLICDLREIYATSCFHLQHVLKHPRMLTYEKTPSYILTDGAADLIQTLAPWAKIIISLRHPVDRVFSQYKMHVEMGSHRIQNKTFEEVLARDLAVLRRKHYFVPDHEPFPRYHYNHEGEDDDDDGVKNISSAATKTATAGTTRRRRLTAVEGERKESNNMINNHERPTVNRKTGKQKRWYRSRDPALDGHWKHKNYIYRSLYVDQLKPWLQRYQLGKNLMIIKYERLNHNPQLVLKEILEFLQIPDHTFQAETLAKSYSPNFWMRQAKRLKRQRQKEQQQQQQNNSTIVVEEENDNVAVPAEKIVLRNETRAYLKRLFDPYNQQLAELLGDDQWNHAWDGPSRY